MNVVIIIPAYNEEKTVGSVVSRARRYGSVIVVNDASRDKTAFIARRAGARVITHKTNKGLGSSLRTGFKEALKKKAKYVITLDADGQHNPAEIPKFIKKLEEGHDFVIGKRNLSKYPFIKKFGNFFLNLVTNLASGTHIADTESGFRGFRTNSLKKLYLRAQRYEIAVEVIFEVGRNNLRAANVRIRSPVYVKGVGVLDGMKNIIYLLRRRKHNMKDYAGDLRYVLKKMMYKWVWGKIEGRF